MILSLFAALQAWCLLLCAWVAADLWTAHFHWLEDTYEVRPLVLLCHNRRHHLRPREMTKSSMLGNISTTLPFAAICILIGLPPLWIICCSVSNYMHRMAHEPHPPFWYTCICACGLAQTAEHHRRHHMKDSRILPNTLSHYGVMCPLTNYTLDYICYWRALEYAVQLVTGVKPRGRPDSLVHKECL